MNLSELPKNGEITSLCFDLLKIAVFQHTVLTHGVSQLAITSFDECKLA